MGQARSEPLVDELHLCLGFRVTLPTLTPGMLSPTRMPEATERHNTPPTLADLILSS